MYNDDSSAPLPSVEETDKPVKSTKKIEDKSSKKNKKRKTNWWPLKALVISLLLSIGVNAASNVALSDSHLIIACVITIVIVAVGVFFDMIGTAVTACDLQPFLSMAAKKVKGAKMAVKLAQSRDTVSSICCDIVGDICGVVSGVCAASIVSTQISGEFAGATGFWLSILVYALISTLTISAKAVGKSIAVSKGNNIVMATAKLLSIFVKEG